MNKDQKFPEEITKEVASYYKIYNKRIKSGKNHQLEQSIMVMSADRICPRSLDQMKVYLSEEKNLSQFKIDSKIQIVVDCKSYLPWGIKEKNMSFIELINSAARNIIMIQEELEKTRQILSIMLNVNLKLDIIETENPEHDGLLSVKNSEQSEQSEKKVGYLIKISKTYTNKNKERFIL